MDTETIEFFDPETDQVYKMVLSKADAERVHRDPIFANSIMTSHYNSIMTNPTVPNPTVPNPSSVQEDLLAEEAEIDLMENEVVEPDEETGVDGTGSLYRWSTPCVLLLLNSYKDTEDKLTSGKCSHKKFWEDISKIFKEKNYTITGPQCSSKLRSLKKTYKAVKDHNGKSGNNRRTWQYFEIMDNIFSRKAWIAPVALASSTGLMISTASTSKEADDDSGSTTPVSLPSTPQKSGKHLLKRRLDQKDEHEKSKKQRHEERMEMDKAILEVLNKLANKN